MRGPGWPVARPGQVVGLLGGSFDPAHEGHAAITRAALVRFGLDRVWWLVSPHNPLKTEAPAALAARLMIAEQVMRHPRVEVTALEDRLGTRATIDTVSALRQRYPGVRFVWLMGADNLTEFHRWDAWQRIASQVSLGILARPGSRVSALTSPAARHLRRYRRDAGALAHATPPAWAFATIPLRSESSTRLRLDGTWKQRSD